MFPRQVISRSLGRKLFLPYKQCLQYRKFLEVLQDIIQDFLSTTLLISWDFNRDEVAEEHSLQCQCCRVAWLCEHHD